MIPCSACHRHVRDDESTRPFCAAPLTTTAAPNPAKASAIGFVAGLSLLACTEAGDPNDSNAVTTNPGSESGQAGSRRAPTSMPRPASG